MGKLSSTDPRSAQSRRQRLGSDGQANHSLPLSSLAHPLSYSTCIIAMHALPTDHRRPSVLALPLVCGHGRVRHDGALRARWLREVSDAAASGLLLLSARARHRRRTRQSADAPRTCKVEAMCNRYVSPNAGAWSATGM